MATFGSFPARQSLGAFDKDILTELPIHFPPAFKTRVVVYSFLNGVINLPLAIREAAVTASDWFKIYPLTTSIPSLDSHKELSDFLEVISMVA